MADWAITLLTVVLAVAATVLVRDLLFEWLRKPNLKIDFEEYDGQKPYILDQFLGRQGLDKSNRAKFLRLNVHNAGQKPAMDCEGKMVIFTEGRKEPLAPSPLHWARRDPAVYETPERIYVPIHLNRDDNEPLDIFKLPYHPEEPELGPGACIASMSPRVFSFERNITYRIKITIYASNTTPESFSFKLCWDGTVEGFDNAFKR